MAIQLATAYVPIVPSVAGIQGQLAKQVIAPSAAAGERAGKGIGGGLRSNIVRALSGALAAGGALMGGAVVVDQFKKAISGAGDLEQSVGAIDSVFKGNADVMHKWSKSAARDVGLSANEFNELGTLIGSQLKNGGTAMEDLAPKTNSLIGLGADLSSMFGGTTREAIEALSSALKGEMDPIEAYGVSLNQSKIEAEAAALGFKKVEGNLTDEGKQAAILSLIMKQTKDAHGNFARESDTYAHKVQVFSASWEDLRTKVGMLFLPVLTKVMGFLGDRLVPMLTEVYGGVRAFGMAFMSAKDGMVDVTSSGFAGWMERVANVVGVAYAAVRDFLTPIFRGLGAVLMATVVPVLGFLGRTLWDNRGAIMAVVAVVGGFAAGWLGVIGAVKGAAAVMNGARAVMAGTRAAIMAVKGAMVTARIAVMLFNSALLANPIGIVVGALVALGVGVVIAYNKIGWFKDAVNGAWSGIKAAAGAVADWWTTTLVPLFQATISAIGRLFTWLYVNAIRPAWSGIQAAIGAVGTWWTTVLVPSFRATVSVLGQVFTWLYQNVIVPAWTGIRIIIAGAAAVVMTILQGLVWLVRNTVGAAFMWLWRSVIVPAFNGIRSVVATVWGFLRDSVFVPMGNFIRGPLAGAWRWIFTVVGQVWSGIRSTVAAAWGFVRDRVLQPLIGFVRGALTFAWRWIQSVVGQVWGGIRAASSAAWNFVRAVVFQPLIGFIRGPVTSSWRWIQSVVGQVWGGIRAASSAAWNFVRDRVFQPIINFIRGPLASGWRWLKDTVSNIWGQIRGVLSSGWNFIRDKVFAPLKSAIMDAVPAAFRKGKDAVKSAWDALEGVAKKPVKFVIETVLNNGLIGNFNKIAGKIGISPLPTVALPKGFDRGGWTGPGSKYQPAGIVHADEYVVKKDSRRKFEQQYPGALDHINKYGTMPTKMGKPAGKDEAYAGGPPGGPSGGLWGNIQNQMMRTGRLYVPSVNIRGTNLAHAAKAWMGRSALDIRAGRGTPQVNGRIGHRGPWGFADTAGNLEISTTTPANRVMGTMIHELGHILSFQHSGNGGYGDTSSVMSAGMSGGDFPHAGDFAKLREIWGQPGKGVRQYSAAEIGASGGGIMSWLYDKFVSPIKNWISGVVGKTREAAPGVGMWADMAAGVGKKLGEGIRDFVTDKINIFDGGDESGGVERWRDTIKAALTRTGLPTSNDYVEAWLRQVKSESGGNPNAVQGIQDVNSGGNEAVGLLQVAKSTFAAYRDPSLPDDRRNPLASAVAGMRWAKSRYGVAGMLAVIGRGHGYAEGGRVQDAQVFDGGGVLHRMAGPQLIQHKEKRPDYVLPERLFLDMHQAASAAAELGRGGNVTVGTIQGYTVEELVEKLETQRRRAEKLARR